MACPLCGSLSRQRKKTEKCIVSTCKTCRHEYTLETEIFSQEQYSNDYYEVTHKKWFENPQLDMFRMLADCIAVYYPNTNLNITLLDAGCGKGDFLKYLSERFKDISAVGVDRCIPFDKNKSSAITYINSSFEDYESSSCFDFIVSTAVIEHVFSPRDFLMKQASLLSKNGKILILTMDSNSPVYVLARLLSKIGLNTAYERLYSPHHVNHFSRESLIYLCESSGFQLLDKGGININMNALDLPHSGSLISNLYLLASRIIFFIGSLINRPFLQYVCVSNTR